MRLNDPLDTVFGNSVKVRIVRVFCRANTELNGRQVAREVGVTPKTAHRVLQELAGEGVLLMKNVGKAYLFELDKESYLVKEVLKTVFALEKKAAGKIFEAILEEVERSPSKEDIVSMALFGSVHEKKERPGSDIDLLLVVRDAAARGRVSKLFEAIDARTAPVFGRTISAYMNSAAEFRKKAKNKLPVIVNIINSHRLLYGEPLKEVLNDKEI
jgi:predicted nucleotidyltransferase